MTRAAACRRHPRYSVNVEERQTQRPFRGLGDFMQRVRPTREVVEHLAKAGAFDAYYDQRRIALRETGLRLRPATVQLPLMLPVEQDMAALPAETRRERMVGEYRTMGLYPKGHGCAICGVGWARALCRAVLFPCGW